MVRGDAPPDMRTRSTNTLEITASGGPWSDRYIRVSDGVDIGGTTGTATELRLESSIATIDDGIGGVPGNRGVAHFKSKMKCSECNLSSWLYNGGANRVVMTGPYTLWHLNSELGSPLPVRLEESNFSVSYPKTRQQLVDEAAHNFYDVNKTDNLLNVLEGGQLVSSLLGAGDFIRKVLKDGPSLFLRGTYSKRYGGRRLESVSLSNQYLAWSFGFAPLIADLQKMSRELPKLRGRLRDAARNASEPRTVCSRVVGTLSFNGGGSAGYKPATDTTPSDGGYWYEALYPLTVPVRIGGVRGRNTMVYKTDEFQILDYLMSRYIATGPVSLAWEKVKFSFVLDWFVNLTGLIDMLDNTLVSNGKKIEKAWSSEKWETVLARVKRPQATVTTPFDGMQVCLDEVSYYHRQPESAQTNVYAASRFGKKQASLSLALLHQTVANLRKIKR